jgi:hypothetical protein
MPPNLPLGRDGEGRLGGEASRNRASRARLTTVRHNVRSSPPSNISPAA